MKKKLNIETIKLLSKNEQKIIQGGYDPITPDGFICAHAYNYCDVTFPTDFSGFGLCMWSLGC